MKKKKHFKYNIIHPNIQLFIFSCLFNVSNKEIIHLNFERGVITILLWKLKNNNSSKN